MTRAVPRDRHLPTEGDYPTGPIDFGNADDPYVRAILDDVVVDANAAHHSRTNGRFVTKRVDYEHLVVHPDVPGVDRPFTWAEAQALPCGPDYVDEGPDVYAWPNHPDVVAEIRKPPEWQFEPGVSIDVVASCCPECVYGPTEKIGPRVTAKQCVYVRRTDRTPCPNQTEFTDSKGRPACHTHGGRPF
jgi:hypothetical protein